MTQNNAIKNFTNIIYIIRLAKPPQVEYYLLPKIQMKL